MMTPETEKVVLSHRRNVSRNVADRQLVARTPAAEVDGGMVDALVAALRTGGVPMELLPDDAIYRFKRSFISTDDRQRKLKSAKREVREHTQLARNARQNANSLSTDNPAHGDFMEDATSHRKRANKAKERVKRLKALPPAVASDGPIDIVEEVWVKALLTLRLNAGKAVSQQQKNAIDLLVVDWDHEWIDGQLWLKAWLRLNTSRGVAKLGPVRWRVYTPAQGSTRLNLSLGGTEFDPDHSRRQYTALLAQTPVHGEAAKVALNGFPQIKHVLLHHLGGVPLPDHVGAEWTDPRFVAWLVKTYTNPQFGWLGHGRYMFFVAMRQYVNSFAARHPDGFTLNDLRQEIPVLSPNDLGKYSIDEYVGTKRQNDKDRKAPPWYASIVLRGGKTRGRDATFGPVMCVCGSPAEISARVPEVPRALLCRCGRMPDAERFGMDPDLRFPSEYTAHLLISAEECRSVIVENFNKRKANLKGLQVAVLRYPGLHTGSTPAEMLRSLAATAIHTPLDQLEAFGLIKRMADDPTKWIYTDEGRERALRLPDA